MSAWEAAVGGPLALVRRSDVIEVDAEARKIHLDVSAKGFGRPAIVQEEA